MAITFRFNQGAGTDLTIQFARVQQKPVLVVESCDLTPSLPRRIRDWIVENEIHILNVAGNRESISPGTGQHAGLGMRR